MLMHSCNSLENHTLFQTIMGKIYALFNSDQNKPKTLSFGTACAYRAYIQSFLLFQELDSVKEEVSIEIKKEAETAEDEKDTDTKETASTTASDQTNTEQKEEDVTTETGKPAERTEAGQDEKPEAVAIAMDENVLPVEEEVKTEAAEGGESVIKTGSTEGVEDENVEHVVVPVEEEVKNEAAEGGEGLVKTGSTEGGEGEPSQEDDVPVTMETTVTNENETGEGHSKYDELDDELPWAMYRSLDTPPQRPPVEEDDDWPASDDDEDYGSNVTVMLLF